MENVEAQKVHEIVATADVVRVQIAHERYDFDQAKVVIVARTS